MFDGKKLNLLLSFSSKVMLCSKYIVYLNVTCVQHISFILFANALMPVLIGVILQ